MANTTEFNRDDVILMNGLPHLITKKEFYSPCKGGSFSRMEFKNLKTGQTIRQTVRTGEKLEVIDIDTKNVQFLYVDSEIAYFMDGETFEQYPIPLERIHGGTDYLHAEARYIGKIYEGELIAITVPFKIAVLITETSDAVKGNTSGGAMKEAVLETGAKVQVPLFINQDEKIIISTETNSYVSRA